MSDTIKFGERLTELMSEKNVDNFKLASALNVNVTTVRSWKRNAKFANAAQLINLADYFECSLDYLTGRSDHEIDYIPQKDCPPFYEHLKQILREKGISRNQINKETKIKSSYFVNWNRGGNPNMLSLIELADYLDITLDCLVGREN